MVLHFFHVFNKKFIAPQKDPFKGLVPPNLRDIKDIKDGIPKDLDVSNIHKQMINGFPLRLT